MIDDAVSHARCVFVILFSFDIFFGTVLLRVRLSYVQYDISTCIPTSPFVASLSRMSESCLFRSREMYHT